MPAAPDIQEFDPAQPFQLVPTGGGAPGFDPSKPFQLVGGQEREPTAHLPLATLPLSSPEAPYSTSSPAYQDYQNRLARSFNVSPDQQQQEQAAENFQATPSDIAGMLSTPAVKMGRFTPNPNDPTWLAALKATGNVGAGFGEFFTSPLAPLAGAAGALGTIPSRVVAGGFGAKMAYDLPEEARRAGTISVTGTPQEKMEAVLGLGSQALLSGGLLGEGTGLGRTVAEQTGAVPTLGRDLLKQREAQLQANAELVRNNPPPIPPAGLLTQGTGFQVSPEGKAFNARARSPGEITEEQRSAQGESRQTESGQSRVVNTVSAALEKGPPELQATIMSNGTDWHRDINGFWVTDHPLATMDKTHLKAGRGNPVEDAIVADLEAKDKLNEARWQQGKAGLQGTVEDVTGVSAPKPVPANATELAFREQWEKKVQQRWASPADEYGPGGALSLRQGQRLEAFDDYLGKAPEDELQRLYSTVENVVPKYPYDIQFKTMLEKRLGISPKLPPPPEEGLAGPVAPTPPPTPPAGGPDALPIGGPAQISLGKTPGDSGAVGKGVPEPKAPTGPQKGPPVPPKDEGVAARLADLTNRKASLTPEEEAERSNLQAQSDAVKNNAGWDSLKKAAAKKNEPVTPVGEIEALSQRPHQSFVGIEYSGTGARLLGGRLEKTPEIVASLEKALADATEALKSATGNDRFTAQRKKQFFTEVLREVNKQSTVFDTVKEVGVPNPNWRVVVQATEGEMPGNVQVIDPNQSENERSPTVESLKAAGHEVPDFSKLPKGAYTWAEAEKLLKEKEVTPDEEKNEEKGQKVLTESGMTKSQREEIDEIARKNDEEISTRDVKVTPAIKLLDGSIISGTGKEHPELINEAKKTGKSTSGSKRGFVLPDGSFGTLSDVARLEMKRVEASASEAKSQKFITELFDNPLGLFTDEKLAKAGITKEEAITRLNRYAKTRDEKSMRRIIAESRNPKSALNNIAMNAALKGQPEAPLKPLKKTTRDFNANRSPEKTPEAPKPVAPPYVEPLLADIVAARKVLDNPSNHPALAQANAWSLINEVKKNRGIKSLSEIPGFDDAYKKPSRGTSSESGFGITPQPPEWLRKFAEEDVAPFLKGGVDAARATGDLIVNLFSPETNANARDVDKLFEAKGYKEKLMTQAAAAVDNAKRIMDSLPRELQINFVDRIKKGQKQATPELQQLADTMRKWDDRLHKEASVYKPDLAYLDNHYRVLWKVIPGTADKVGSALEMIMSKRPWRGSRGFTLQHTLEDMSEGIEKGGVPVSYNPIENFLLHAQDVMKFVAANRAFEAMKKTGAAQFVERGEEAPPGYNRINDTIARQYFRTKDTKPGEWWVDAGTARLINNYLSVDYIRQGPAGPLGRGLVDLKNLTTAVELGLSPFHAVFETNEAVGSGMALSIAKMAEGFQGRGFGREGMKEFAKSLPGSIPIVGGLIPGSPSVEAFKLGTKVIEYAKNPKEFEARYPDAYKWLKAKYPQFEGMVDNLFTGGGQVKMNDDYHIRAAKSFRQAMADDNYVKAVVTAVPAISQKMLQPLFEIYIPRLKVGTWLKEYAFERARQSEDIASGNTTEAQVARETWAFVEDRFGELNWDNLYWNRTFKSGMQLLFRSVTWKLGNLRGFGKASRDLINEVGINPFVDTPVGKAAKSLFSEGPAKAVETFRNAEPGKIKGVNVTLPMAWAASMAVVTAIQSSIITKTATGKYPWQLAKDAVELIRNLTFPRIDKDDASQRVSIPTYWKDLVHLFRGPVDYVHSSLTGELGRLWDVWNNKDFYGRQVYSPDDPWYIRFKDKMEHLIPVPFSAGSFYSAKQSGASTLKSAAGFLGYTKAPYYVSHTKAEQMADQIIRDELPQGSRTKEQYEKTITEHKTISAIKRGETTMSDAENQGLIQPRRGFELMRHFNETPLQQKVDRITSPVNAVKVFEVAKPEEQAQIKDSVVRKIFNSRTLSDEDKGRLILRVRGGAPAAQAPAPVPFNPNQPFQLVPQ